MTEPLVAFTATEFPIARDAINQVRRGAMEHPFFRRRGIVLESVGPFLMYVDSSVTTPLGPITGGGIAMTGNCYFNGNASDLQSVRFDHINGIVFPTQAFFAMQEGGLLYAMSGGYTAINGTAVADMALGVGDITVTYGVSTYDIEVADACGEIIVEGTEVKAVLEINSDGYQFGVVKTCCPPV